MKILYINYTNVQQYTGGHQGATRNLNSLYDIWGKANVLSYIITPKNTSVKQIPAKIKNLLSGYFAGLTKQHIKEILLEIHEKAINAVFIDSSQFGVLAKIVKKRFPHMRVCVFFHNIEYDFFTSQAKAERKLRYRIFSYIIRNNEFCVCRYADKIICLNRRDARRLKELYDTEPTTLIPVTLKDNFTPVVDTARAFPSIQPNALFVGSYFFGNTFGLKWFCVNVMPYVDIHLTIVGSDMERFAHEITDTSRVTIYSNVPDLTPFYEAADFMILPIMTGGGMKIKTAEAMMHGKYIIGSQEALQGYDVDAKIARICVTAQDYIDAINHIPLSETFCQEARNAFLSKYEYSVSLNLFKKLFAQ